MAEILTRYSMLRPGCQLGIGVSGGADSVVLLHLLHRLRGQFGCFLTVLHANHHLRASESDADEHFVGKLAESLGHRFLVAHLRPGEGNLEEEARECRQRFFSEMQREHSLDRIALGHTRSDQAETVLFRILRGTGTSGLSAMRFVSPTGLIRPLLDTSRDEVRSWARSEGIVWREDSSNDNVAFTRNRLRLQTLPELAREYNPNLEGVLAQMARVAQDEEEYWDIVCAERGEILPQLTRLGLEIPTAKLITLHPAVQRRVLRSLIKRLKGDLRSVDSRHIDAILAICQSAAGHDRVLVPGVDALRSFETLLLSRPGALSGDQRMYKVPIAEGEQKELPYGAGSLALFRAASDWSFCANFKGTPNLRFETAAFDEDLLFASGPHSIFVRNWQPGDEILRPGHQRPEKLKALFQEGKVLLWQRRHWPVLVAGTNIAWARRFGCAAGFQGHPNSRSILRLAYKDTEESSSVSRD